MNTVGVLDGASLRRLTVRGALRVPEVTGYFWVIKVLSTAFGESTSDYLIHAIDPVFAVVLGFFVFVLALSLQFFVRRYVAWSYWLAVAAVGVSARWRPMCSMSASVSPPRSQRDLWPRVGRGVPRLVRDREDAVVPHHPLPVERAFYWAAVVATFAIGDLTAYTVGLGYFRLRADLRRGDHDSRHRLLATRLECDLCLLVCLRGDPTTWRVVR